jgi:hypothetical protein
MAMAGDQGIAGVVTEGNGGQGQAIGQVGRQVLEAVDGQVHLLPQESGLQLSHESPSTSQVGQRDMAGPVAGGAYHYQLVL